MTPLLIAGGIYVAVPLGTIRLFRKEVVVEGQHYRVVYSLRYLEPRRRGERRARALAALADAVWENAYGQDRTDASA